MIIPGSRWRDKDPEDNCPGPRDSGCGGHENEVICLVHLGRSVVVRRQCTRCGYQDSLGVEAFLNSMERVQ